MLDWCRMMGLSPSKRIYSVVGSHIRRTRWPIVCEYLGVEHVFWRAVLLIKQLQVLLGQLCLLHLRWHFKVRVVQSVSVRVWLRRVTSNHFLLWSHHKLLACRPVEHRIHAPMCLLLVTLGRHVSKERPSSSWWQIGWLIRCPVRQQRVRIVSQTPCVWYHSSVGPRTDGGLVLSPKRKGIRLTVQVPQAHIVEGSRPVLLVACVGRYQKEGTVVKAVTLAPNTSWRIHIWWSHGLLQVAAA